IAFADSQGNRGNIAVVDRSGHTTTLSRGWIGIAGVGWSPDGKEVWFGGVQGSEGVFAIHAVSLSGVERVLLRAPVGLFLQDVSGDGPLLVAHLPGRRGIRCLAPGERTERALDWLDGSELVALSRDGRTILFNELRVGGGTAGAFYARATDGTPAVRL